MTRKSLHMFIIDEKNSLFGYLLILSAEPAERENCLQKTRPSGLYPLHLLKTNYYQSLVIAIVENCFLF